jgi:hypothetical protein
VEYIITFDNVHVMEFRKYIENGHMCDHLSIPIVFSKTFKQELDVLVPTLEAARRFVSLVLLAQGEPSFASHSHCTSENASGSMSKRFTSFKV